MRTATPSTARAINDRIALELLRDEGPLTAGQLRSRTGLARPTVADLLERLREAGLIAVVGEAGAERRGPNARLYGLVADRAHLAAVDVRAHSVTVRVADLLGRPLAEASLPVDPDAGTGPRPRPTGVLVDAADLVARTVAEAGAARLHTVAIGAPGLIDPATGALSPAGGPPRWHGRLSAVLRERLDVPVLLENEVNLAAVAERRLGAVRDRDTFALLWLGHGTGAAVVLGGRLHRGASGGTGEIGFLPVPGTSALPSATACDGGFHSLAGSAAVCALARDHGIRPADAPATARAESRAAAPAEVPDGAAAAEAVVRAAGEAGERGGGFLGFLDFLDALADRVVLGAAALCAVLDPGCVVLGGETGRAGGTALAERVERRLARMSPLRTEVRATAVAGSAVLSGAVLTAMDAAHEELFSSGR
ncbi:ROK family transcriptional regulator [Streptomyces varsoviensis]|uniref:ROK family transcriptional regulator n=1 Tax=Streptomyces varsoviensis TaxID=67373 RepID=UPI0033C7643F